MENKRKRRLQIATTDPTERSANKGVTVGDLPARTDGTRSARGGAARDHAHTAVYQHNQTDLEFLR